LHGPQGPRRGSQLNEIGIIPDGALLIRDGVVQQVGTSRRVENLAEARDAVEINAAGRVVMPGFVDSHMHVLCPPPGATEPELAHAARLVHTSSLKRLIARTRVHLNALARHGTTTAEIKTTCGADEAAEIKLLRALEALRSDPLDVISTVLFMLPPDASRNEAEMRARIEARCAAFLPKIGKRRLARFAEVEFENDPALRPLFEGCLDAASRAGLGIKVHSPSSGVARDVVSIGHAERAHAEDCTALAAFDGVVTLVPSPDLFHAGSFPVRNLVDAGAAISLASNYHPRCTATFNMQTVVALACLQWGLTPAEAVCAATINAAHAARCDDRAGSIEVGKPADLLVLNISDCRDLVGHFGANLVHLTMKRGAFIYKEGDVAPLAASDLRAAW
jgi:imidazolonepropionase